MSTRFCALHFKAPTALQARRRNDVRTARIVPASLHTRSDFLSPLGRSLHYLYLHCTKIIYRFRLPRHGVWSIMLIA